jgi:DNA-directed RNA polymerase
MTRERTAKKIKDRKMRTALAANTVHSLDAALLQIAIADYKDTSFTTVHDCVYAPSGALTGLVERIKAAFYQVVSGDFLYEMLQANDLEDDDTLVAQLRTMTHEDNGLLESIKDSQYLFS